MPQRALFENCQAGRGSCCNGDGDMRSQVWFLLYVKCTAGLHCAWLPKTTYNRFAIVSGGNCSCCIPKTNGYALPSGDV